VAGYVGYPHKANTVAGMGKLIHLVAVSVGSGMVLGTGIRVLGERAAQRNRRTEPLVDPKTGGIATVLDRMAALEDRLGQLASVPCDKTADLLRARLEEQLAGAESLKAELRARLADDVRERIAEVEDRIEQRLATSQQQTLDALMDGVQRRVLDRMARLEAEVAGQSTAMGQLRDCSVKTEQTVQRLIEGIDRLVTLQTEMRGSGRGPGLAADVVEPGSGRDRTG
jgi:hypothetical protein